MQIEDIGLLLREILVYLHAVDNADLSLCQNAFFARYRHGDLSVHDPVNFEIPMKMRAVAVGFIMLRGKPRSEIAIDLE